MARKDEQRSVAAGLPAVNEPVTLYKIGKYFLDHVSAEQFTEWLANANSLLPESGIGYTEDQKSTMRGVLTLFGLLTIPSFLYRRRRKDRARDLGAQFDQLFRTYGFKDVKLAIGGIGCLFMESYGKYHFDPRYIEHQMKPLIVLLVIVEMYDDFIFYKAEAENAKKAA